MKSLIEACGLSNGTLGHWRGVTAPAVTKGVEGQTNP